MWFAKIFSTDDNTKGKLLWEKSKDGTLKKEDILSLRRVINWKNPSEYDETPLHAASCDGHQSAVEILLSNNADINSTNKYNNTPLHWASGYGHESIVTLLLNNKANINMPGENGGTPLYCAAFNGKDKVIKILLDHQADVNLKDKYGDTPLHDAVGKGYYEIVKALLDHQADVNLKNKYGDTPLHQAAYRGKPEAIQVLLNHQANVNLKNNNGKDALALSMIDSEVTQLLINAKKKLEEDKVLSQKIEADKKEAEEKSKRQEEERKRKEAEATRIKLEKEAKEEALKNERLGNVKKLKTNIANKVPSISIISSTHEVTEWAAQIIGEDNSKLLRRNEIDGEILMSLTEDDLMKTVGFTLGPARKLVNKIKELKAVQTPSSPSLPADNSADTLKNDDSIYKRMQNDSTNSIGLPLALFPSSYSEPTITIHEAISYAMNPHWTLRMKTYLCETLESHIQNSNSFQHAKDKYDLTIDEAAAISYYTVEASKLLSPDVPRTASPYYVLNNILATRNMVKLEQWKPYLYFLLRGLQKIENLSTTVYRAIDTSLLNKPNTQYKVNSTVVWVAFTSTSKNMNQLKSFQEETKTGTWMILDVCEGKDISPFSIFPNEEEVLLMPNSYLKVESHMTNAMKSLFNNIMKSHMTDEVKAINTDVCVDVLHLKQQPTPNKYKSMFIEKF